MCWWRCPHRQNRTASEVAPFLQDGTSVSTKRKTNQWTFKVRTTLKATQPPLLKQDDLFILGEILNFRSKTYLISTHTYMATVSGNGYNWISRHCLTKSGTRKATPKVPWSRHTYFPPFAPVTCFATSSDWLTGLSGPDVISQNDSFGFNLTKQEDTRVKQSFQAGKTSWGCWKRNSYHKTNTTLLTYKVLRRFLQSVCLVTSLPSHVHVLEFFSYLNDYTRRTNSTHFVN